MNGLGTALTVAAVGIGIGALGALWVGYKVMNRVPPNPNPVRFTLPDVPWAPNRQTGEGWTEHDESMRRPPSTRARALGGDR